MSTSEITKVSPSRAVFQSHLVLIGSAVVLILSFSHLQEPFPMGVNIRSRPGKTRTSGNEDNHQGSPSNSVNGEDGTDSSSSSAKDAE